MRQNKMEELNKRVLVELAWDLYVDEMDPYEKSDESMLFCYDKSAVIHGVAHVAAEFGRLWKVNINPELIKGLTVHQAIDAITEVVEEDRIYNSLLDYLDDIVYEFACHEIATTFRYDPILSPFRADEEYTDWAGVYLFERIEDVYPDMEEYRQACVAIKKQHAELITRLQHLLGEYYKKNIDAGTFERVISYNVSER